MIFQHGADASARGSRTSIERKARDRIGNSGPTELGDVVTGKAPGRTSSDQLAPFKSLGIALEDAAFGELIYGRAVEAGAGRTLERAVGGSEGVEQERSLAERVQMPARLHACVQHT